MNSRVSTIFLVFSSEVQTPRPELEEVQFSYCILSYDVSSTILNIQDTTWVNQQFLYVGGEIDEKEGYKHGCN